MIIHSAVRKELIRIVKKIGFRARGTRNVPYGRARYKLNKETSRFMRLFARPWNQFACVGIRQSEIAIFTNPVPLESWQGQVTTWHEEVTIPFEDPKLFEKFTEICTAFYTKYSSNEERYVVR